MTDENETTENETTTAGDPEAPVTPVGEPLQAEEVVDATAEAGDTDVGSGDVPATEIPAADPEPLPTEAEEAEAPDTDAPAAAEAEVAAAPDTDAPAAAEAEVAESPAEAAAPEGPKRSKKRLPRPERRQRPKRVRGNTTGERKPIVRLPKPDSERGRRQERRGVVVSSTMDKTIVVRVESAKMHQRYKKVIRRSHKFHAHDERNEAKVGDVVRIVETRPLSKTKNWRLAEIVEVAR